MDSLASLLSAPTTSDDQQSSSINRPPLKRSRVSPTYPPQRNMLNNTPSTSSTTFAPYPTPPKEEEDGGNMNTLGIYESGVEKGLTPTRDLEVTTTLNFAEEDGEPDYANEGITCSQNMVAVAKPVASVEDANRRLQSRINKTTKSRLSPDSSHASPLTASSTKSMEVGVGRHVPKHHDEKIELLQYIKRARRENTSVPENYEITEEDNSKIFFYDGSVSNPCSFVERETCPHVKPQDDVLTAMSIDMHSILDDCLMAGQLEFVNTMRRMEADFRDVCIKKKLALEQKRKRKAIRSTEKFTPTLEYTDKQEKEVAHMNSQLATFFSRFLGRRLQFDDKNVKKNVRHFFKFTGGTHEYFMPTRPEYSETGYAITSLLTVILWKRYIGDFYHSDSAYWKGKRTVPRDNVIIPDFVESDSDMDEAEWIEKNKEKLQKHAELRLKKQKEKLAKVVGRLRKSSSTLIDRAVLFSYANSDGSNKQEVERAKHKRKEEKECGGVADTRLLAEEEKRKELLGHVSSDLMQHPLWVGFEEHSADVCDDVAMFKNQVAGLRARNLAKRDELKELRLSMKELCKVEKEVQVGSELWKVNRPFGVGKKNKKKAIGGGEIKREGGRKGELEKNKSQEVGGEVKGNIGGEVVDIEKLSFVSPGAL